jgi:hypothetical protein
LDALISENTLIKQQNATLMEDINSLETNKDALEDKAA